MYIIKRKVWGWGIDVIRPKLYRYIVAISIIICNLILLYNPNEVQNAEIPIEYQIKFKREISFKEITFKEDPKIIMVSYYLTSTYTHLHQGGAKELAKIILECESKYNIDKSIIVGLIHKESSFIVNNVNKSSGAMGYTAVMPNIWVNDLKEQQLIITKEDLLKAENNIKSGCFILRKYLGKNNNNMKIALRKYGGYAINDLKFNSYYDIVTTTAKNYQIFETNVSKNI